MSALRPTLPKLLRARERLRALPLCAVVSGGNLGSDMLATILAGQLPRYGTARASCVRLPAFHRK
jgi:hypothetical protein